MTKTLRRFLKDDSGATAIEYGLIAAIIGAVLVAVMGALGDSLDTGFGNLGDVIEDPNA